MRRVIAAAVMGGLVLGGAAATSAFAATHSTARAPDKASQAAPAKPRAVPTTTHLKTVVYQGYEFQVPASWTVYRVDEHPQTCVRYDVHAVYLGTPGTNMRCPAGLVGRTQTVSFIPGQGVAARAGSAGTSQSAQTAGASGTQLRRLPAVHTAITQIAVQHKLEVALGEAALGATVLGTYGTDPAVIDQVLNTLHRAPAGAASTAQSGAVTSMQPSSRRAALVQQRALVARKAAPKKPAESTYTSWRRVPAHWPIQIVQPPRQRKPTPTPTPKPTPTPTPTRVHPVSGFDTCTAPSPATMHVWRSAYAAIGVYIGGANSACAYGNFSASWVQTETSQGWGILPTYVGPQAPCWGGNGVLINPGSAAAEGRAAGSDAVSDARHFGLRPGSPIYYDMEAYNGGTSCKQAVLTFLGAWDRRVAAEGYVTAVYSSQDSGIVDMQEWAAAGNKGFTPPDAIWIALWDGSASLSDGSLVWPLSMRSKQYAGNINAAVGGITLNIDKDFVGGPVANLLIRILRRR